MELQKLIDEVVNSIAKVTEKLSQHGSHDLTEPIAELADLAARVNAMGLELVESSKKATKSKQTKLEAEA